MIRVRRRRILIATSVMWSCLAFGLTAAGCAYNTARPFAREVNTVYVEPFRSKEFRRNLEFQLTESLQKRILIDTDYSLADKARADTMLSGEILEVRQATLGRDFTSGLPRETQATFLVSFQWKDLRTGKTLVDRARFAQTVDYIQPVGETFFEASREAVDDLAEKIVDQMQSDW